MTQNQGFDEDAISGMPKKDSITCIKHCWRKVAKTHL